MLVIIMWKWILITNRRLNTLQIVISLRICVKSCQPKIVLVSTLESAIPVTTQDYYKSKEEGAKESYTNVKLNYDPLLDDDTLVDISESDLAAITEVAVHLGSDVGDGSAEYQTTMIAVEANKKARQVGVVDVGGYICRHGSHIEDGGYNGTNATCLVDESVRDGVIGRDASADVVWEPQTSLVTSKVPVGSTDLGGTYVVDAAAKDGVGSETESEPSESFIPEGTSVIEVEDDSKTPQIYRRQRNRKPSKARQSPFIAGSELSKIVSSSVKVVKGRSLLMASITSPVDSNIAAEFASFVDKNKITGMRSAFICSDDDEYLDPPHEFEVASVSSKTWFHTLKYPGKPISCGHLDVIFYYLRKKAKYGNLPRRVTTTDNFFCNCISKLFGKFKNGGNDSSLIGKATDILEYIYGYRLFCNTPWTEVDHVLFPIHLSSKWHWILGVLSFHERRLYEYDSLRVPQNKAAIQLSLEPYSVLLPLFLIQTDFYKNRDDISFLNGLHNGHNISDPFDVELVENLPSQHNTDCGIFVACFAEYYIENVEISVDDFDVELMRSRYGILLWHYSRQKQLNGEYSDSENPGRWAKRTRGRKRKI